MIYKYIFQALFCWVIHNNKSKDKLSIKQLQIDKEIYKERERQIEMQTERQKYIQANKRQDKQIQKETNRHIRKEKKQVKINFNTGRRHNNLKNAKMLSVSYTDEPKDEHRN